MENLKASRRKLEELREEKDSLEQRLYGLFLPILNSKQVFQGFWVLSLNNNIVYKLEVSLDLILLSKIHK